MNLVTLLAKQVNFILEVLSSNILIFERFQGIPSLVFCFNYFY